MENKTPTLRVLALWKSFTPDARAYKPSTPVIEFPEPLIIAVEVPLKPELILNADVIMAAQLSNQAEPKPHFTPMGMRYIEDIFETANGNIVQQEDWEKEETEEDWEDEETETKPESSKDEEWEDETEATGDEGEASWDEEW